MKVACGDDRLDRWFESRFLWIISVLLAGCEEAGKWRAVLVDREDRHDSFRFAGKTKEIKFGRQWVARYGRERRTHIVEAMFIERLCDTIATGGRHTYEWGNLMRKAAERAEEAGDNPLAHELRFLIQIWDVEMEWCECRDPELEAALETDDWTRAHEILRERVLEVQDDLAEAQPEVVTPKPRTVSLPALLELFAGRLTLLQERVTALSLQTLSRKTRGLLRSTAALLDADKALVRVLAALAALRNEPQGKEAGTAKIKELDVARELANQAWHLVQVKVVNVHEDSLAEDLALNVARDALETGLSLAEQFLESPSLALDQEAARSFAQVLGIPADELVDGPYRWYWKQSA